MNLPEKAHDTCVAQIAEALFGQPGMSLMEMANRRGEIEELRRDSERLTFIESQFAAVTTQERYLPLQMIWGKGANGRTLREAADKYMQRHAATKEQAE